MTIRRKVIPLLALPFTAGGTMGAARLCGTICALIHSFAENVRPCRSLRALALARLAGNGGAGFGLFCPPGHGPATRLLAARGAALPLRGMDGSDRCGEIAPSAACQPLTELLAQVPRPHLFDGAHRQIAE